MNAPMRPSPMASCASPMRRVHASPTTACHAVPIWPDPGAPLKDGRGCVGNAQHCTASAAPRRYGDRSRCDQTTAMITTVAPTA